MIRLDPKMVYVVGCKSGTVAVHGTACAMSLEQLLDEMVVKMTSGDAIEIKAYSCQVSYESLRPQP